jgi:hypothetical protein
LGSCVREYSGKVYDIPPERVCGTAQADKYDYGKDGKPILTRQSAGIGRRNSPQQHGSPVLGRTPRLAASVSVFVTTTG